MKITKTELKKIIKEELLKELGRRYTYDIRDDIKAKQDELAAARSPREKEKIRAEIDRLYDELDKEIFRDKRHDRRDWATRHVKPLPRSLR